LIPFLTLIFIIFGLPSLHFYVCLDKQRKYLKQICKGIPGKYGSRFSFLEQLRKRKGSYQFGGLSLQRMVAIEYFYRWPRIIDVLPGTAPEERLEIRFPVVQKFWLRMILDPHHTGDPEALVLEEPDIDALYVIHSNQHEAAKHFLLSRPPFPDLRLPNPMDRLEIHHGWGTAEFFFPAHRNFQQMHLEVLIEWLARFFADYESQSKLVLSVSVVGDARCPYCRENLETSSERIFQCVQCGAKLHENCWKENKQCTTWGCQSGVALPLGQAEQR